MTTTTIQRGTRVYHLLVPLVIPGGDGMPAEEITALSLKPCTWDMSERWSLGLMRHVKGPLYAMIEELTGRTWDTLKRLQYPDTDLFLAEVMQHLPGNIKADIANGTIPETDYDETLSDEAAFHASLSGPDASTTTVPGVTETVHFDPDYAAEPLSDEEADRRQRGAAHGMDLE